MVNAEQVIYSGEFAFRLSALFYANDLSVYGLYFCGNYNLCIDNAQPYLIPPLSRLSNCPALPCSPKSFISNRWRVFDMSELEKPVRLTISPGLKASNTRMQMRYSFLLNVYSPMSLSRNLGTFCSTVVNMFLHSSSEGSVSGLSAKVLNR